MQELHRGVLPQQAPAYLVIFADTVVWIEILVTDFQVVALAEQLVAFKQSCNRVLRWRRGNLVGDEIKFR